MAKNEVGEFELVLGNRQLLSVFFIVVTLLGVFFFMGYIVGRNSSPPTIEAARKSEKPTIIDSPGAPAPAQISPASEPAASPKPEPPPPTETKAALPPPKEEKATEDKKKAESKKHAATETKEEPKPAPPVAGTPAAGTYLQLAAIPKADADLLISVLHKKGFTATSSPSPKDPSLFRVLVGPLPSDTIPQTRTSLNDAGLPGSKAMIRKY